MKILAPVNKANEVGPVIQAGADELYCGIIPGDWMQKYGNVASLNRREWKTANLMRFEELERIVFIAHKHRVPVYLTLNALYSNEQYPLLLKQLELIKNVPLDALIVADLSLLLSIRDLDLGIDIHLSTGATLFNSNTIEFFEQFGISRVVLPRQLQIEEIRRVSRKKLALKFEVFVLNSGCKNIDGFCTFQHGVKETQHKNFWNLPKKLNLDRHILNAIRRLPKKLGAKVQTGVFGADSACLLDYKIARLEIASEAAGEKENGVVIDKMSSGFNLLSGVDTCGACQLAEFKNMGIEAVKIAGRNYSMAKKIKDVKFLRTLLSHLEERSFEEEEYHALTRKVYKQIYKIDCGKFCYYPGEGDLSKCESCRG
ncbi:MAG: U32 family peptidase [Candidatus Omnitrophica bacterium]|nr:U32 family peptidase [Candidatus Omnitrophota bacterium]